MLLSFAINQIEKNTIKSIKSLKVDKKVSLAVIKKKETQLQRISPKIKGEKEKKIDKKHTKYLLQNLHNHFKDLTSRHEIIPNYEGDNFEEVHFDGFGINSDDPFILKNYQIQEQSSYGKINGFHEKNLASYKSKIALEKSELISNVQKINNINISEIQKQMFELGIIDKPLTIELIEDILNNPFVKYSHIFVSESLSDKEHKIFKEKFSKNLDLL